MQVLGTILLPCQGRRANSQLHILLRPLVSPDHLASLTKEPRQLQSPSSSFTWAGNQVSCPTQLSSASGNPLTLISDLEQLPYLKIGLNSRPRLLRDIISRHIQET